MLLKRDGFITGLLNDKGTFDIYKNTYLKSFNQEIKHEGISYDITEAKKVCKNKECQGFIRKEQDGETSYYKVLKEPYVANDSYLYTPEELDFETIPRRDPPIVRDKPKTLSEHFLNKKEKFNDKKITNKQMLSFMMIFLIIYFSIVLVVGANQKTKILDPIEQQEKEMRNLVKVKMEY